jgi:hypothetical protein
MQFSTKTFDTSSSSTILTALTGIKTDCLLLAISPDNTLDSIGKALDGLCNGTISRALASGDLPVRQTGNLMVITGYKNVSRVLLVHLMGATNTLTEKEFLIAVRGAAKTVSLSTATDCSSLLALRACESLGVGKWHRSPSICRDQLPL